MKKQLALALGLAVISGSALASKARLEALGEGSNGSQYLMDNRNIFLNPAQANYFKDMVTFEAGDTTNEDDDAGSPNAEGGFLKAHGNMVYGVFFGHEDATSQQLKRASSATATIQDAVEDENTWDLFVAGDAGVQWGVNLSYQGNKNEQDDFGGTADEDEVKVDSLRASVGVISGDTEVFLKTSLADTAEVDGFVDFKMKSRYDIGASHNISGGTVFARYSAFEAEQSEGSNEDWKQTAISLGWGKVKKLNDSASFNYSVAYSTVDGEGHAYSSNGDYKSMRVAASMGIEVMAKEWLTLRASVGTNLLNEEENDAGDKTSGSDSTKVAAGASFIWGDFQLDGMIGNTDGTTTGESTSTGNGTLRTDSLLSRISATYRF